MKNLITILIIATISFTTSFGQEKGIQKSNMLGINAGTTTGVGISFKHWHNKFGIQVTGLPVKIKNEFDFSIGLTGFYKIRERKYANLFVFTGHTLMTEEFYRINSIDPILSVLSENNRNRNTEPDYNASIGFGAELGKNPIFTVMIGYGAFEITRYDYLYPTIEMGLHFKLK